MNEIYPIKFLPIYKERIWGGNNLAGLLGRVLPSHKVGESWEISNHPHGMSIVRNGHLAGKTLKELVESYQEKLIGKKALAKENFPLLVKIIDANDDLSIQVHPDDQFTCGREGGKTEAWYVLKAQENAQIIYGLKEGTTSSSLLDSIKANNVLESLQVVPVKEGDMIYIPAGTVHSLSRGIVVYEVQQNSDITYRLYDYERIDQDGQPRELHLSKALEVINFQQQVVTDFNCGKIECSYFTMEKVLVEQESKQCTNEQLMIFYVIKGEGQIMYRQELEKVQPGETVLIPACLGEFTIRGKLELLKIV